MKKIIGFILLGCIASASCVGFAEEVLYHNEGGITINDKALDARPGEKVTLLVTPFTSDWLNEDVRNAKDGEDIVYFGSEIIASDGSYTFKFYLENSGKYNVYITEGNDASKTGEPTEVKQIVYINKQKNEEAIAKLEEAVEKSTHSDTEAVFDVLNDYSEGLGLYDEIFKDEDCDFLAAAEIAYGDLEDLSDFDALSVADIIKKAVLADMLNDKKNDALEKYAYILYEDADTLYDADDEETVYDYLKGNNIKSVKELVTLSDEALVLAKVNSGNLSQINGVLNNVFVKNLYPELKDKISLDLCSDISKKSNWDIESLVEYINDYKNSGNKGPTVSGGSGGGAGSARPSQNIQIPPAYKEELNNFVPFNDIENVKWAQDAIIGLYNKGCINGRSEGVFAPNENITREEFLKILITAFDLELVGADTLPFLDVNKDAWYYDYIKTAYLAKVTSGISGDMFGIGLNITRQDLCKMTVNLTDALGKSFDGDYSKTFKDEDKIADYAKDAVSKLVSAGIISGNDNGEFNPGAPATRAEAAKILYYAMTLAK